MGRRVSGFCPVDATGDLFDRAVQMERNARGLQVDGLGRHWSWEALVKADEDQFKLFPEAPAIPCMCFDGEADESDPLAGGTPSSADEARGSQTKEAANE